MWHRTSVVPGPGLAGKRTVKKVPFVELSGGRVQGVVSSGSDIERVYVSFLSTAPAAWYCCTNNNRPCGGLRGSPCKHIGELVAEALLQFGAAAVATYLALPGDAETYDDAWKVLQAAGGSEQKESPGVVFSRFLSYLRYCEMKSAPGPVPEMSWFAG